MAFVVEAPATSGNLGPGFDCLGLALEHRDRVVFTEADTSSVTVAGEGAGDVDTGPDHLILRSFRRAFEACGQPAPQVALQCENVIPHGRGMGSSSAAIITGLAGAVAMGASLSVVQMLEVATAIEGHPDNVAPALLGGLTVAWMDGGVGRAVRLDPLPMSVTVAVPAERLSTEQARSLLPATVPFGDAVHALGRSALAVAAFTNDVEHLLAATEDRLHQDYRREAYPQSWELVRAWRAQGVPAAISGAGPSVIAFGRSVDVPDGWRRLDLAVSGEGVRVTDFVATPG